MLASAKYETEDPAGVCFGEASSHPACNLNSVVGGAGGSGASGSISGGNGGMGGTGVETDGSEFVNVGSVTGGLGGSGGDATGTGGTGGIGGTGIDVTDEGDNSSGDVEAM